MRFWILTLGIIISGAVLQPFFPWWSLVLIAFFWGYVLPLNPVNRSFAAGFLGGLLLWGGYAFYLNWGNDGILATRVANLLGGLPVGLLPFISGLFAGMLAGFAALTGRLGFLWIRGLKPGKET